MDLTPAEAFDRFIKFSDYEGNVLKEITKEEWARAYADDFTFELHVNLFPIKLQTKLYPLCLR